MSSERVLRRWLRVVAFVFGVPALISVPVLFGLPAISGVSGLSGSSGIAHAADYGAVLAGAPSEFWKAMEEGIHQAAAERSVNVIVRSPVDDDPQTSAQNLQLKMVRWMIDSGVKS